MIRKVFSIPGLITLTLLLIIAYLGLWVYLRSTVASGVASYISELKMEGYQVEHGGLSIKGFPFSINAQTPNLTIQTAPNTSAGASGLWSFQTNQVDMFTPTLTPLSWSIRHGGTLAVNSVVSSFDVSPADIDADVAYSFTGRLKSFRADLKETVILSRSGETPAILGLKKAKTEIEVNNDIASVEVHADDVILSPQLLGDAMTVLGQNLNTFALKGEIENWSLLETEGLDIWLQSPAKIKSDVWTLKWGNLDLVGSCDLGFQNRLPEGVIGFRVKNIEALLNSLTQLGMLDSNFASQIEAVANTMDSDTDGRKLIEITIRDGVIKYGFFTLYRL
ncbi:MAG: DUF2125 domain-containing protein [Acidimicrobiales bacterium]|nr:DUF2125 domain-containing protein [Hyphomonadaceae bacterium]RZV42435.1 MAG: DUF2125 domain-containing protein [Acidimicrobiales bacterium]